MYISRTLSGPNLGPNIHMSLVFDSIDRFYYMYNTFFFGQTKDFVRLVIRLATDEV